MPRRKRAWIDNACYHITHRCHERRFLFRFAKYRNFYTRHLFEMRKRYNIDILDYMITSNHVHLLLRSKKGERISEGLRYLHGRIGQWHNLQTGREGSFWRDRFHSTRIQEGSHLGRCLFYIDLNMVRAGVINHPEEWPHCGYGEFMGKKQRWRIINMRRLLNSLSMDDEKEFRKWYTLTLEDKLKNEELKRQEFWSKAMAVGDEEWLKSQASLIKTKRFKIVKWEDIHYAIGR